MKNTSLSDLPFNKDVNDFGTERYVNGLIKFIENSSAPITIALQGEWGSGKTSLMTRLERALCCGPDAPFIGIDINTWEYSMMSSPEVTVYKILARLVQELTKGDDTTKKTLKGFLRGAGSFLYRGARESLKTVPAVGGLFAIGLESMNVPTDLPDSSETNETASLSDLKKALSEAVQKSVADEGKRGVIIFVDDLDRLNPPVAVEILELLKNIFTLDKCIFVLAIDYDVVVKGLKPKFGEMTEKNEREFRSFFDKIIQVPFMLPVSSYRPMDFVLESLMGIGYLDELDTENPEIVDAYTAVVEASVGKNPRSIKRLINTLSLIDCIAQCGESSARKVAAGKTEDKLLNIIIVSIQICYPKIYRMLTRQSEFTDWDDGFAKKTGIDMIPVSGDDSPGPLWERVIESACQGDPHLTQHFNDIIKLLYMADETLKRINKDAPDDACRKMKEYMDKSSVTGVNSEFREEDFDKGNLIQKLHKNVLACMNEKRPDICRWKLKKNTGNGGIYMWVDDDTCFDVTFTPTVNREHHVELRVWLDFYVACPERLKGKSFDDLMKEPAVVDALRRVDAVLSPLLDAKTWFFKGTVYEGYDSYFPSYTEELRHLFDKGWQSDSITSNPYYWIELKTPSRFENEEIVSTIADLLIANYDFRKSMKNFR